VSASAGGVPRAELCAERWSCPHPNCQVVGQTQAGHETETNLAAHERVVHPEITRSAR
jgi:hypothetical protein